MTIEKGKVVTLHYQLFDAQNDQLIESSREEDQPLTYLHGFGNIIPALENALAGKQTGEHLSITLEPQDAYGERDEEAVQRLPIKYFQKFGKLKPGMQVPLQTDEGYRIVTLLKVGLKTVDIDANHPLAGERLRFEIDVVDLRDASDEEKDHGHVHGPGGHHH